MSSVSDKVVFVTGGARGVGADVARRLRRKNAKLVLTDIDAAPLAELAAELGEDHVLTAVADVRDLSTSVGERPITALVTSILPRMDAEVAALGRSTSSRVEELER